VKQESRLKSGHIFKMPQTAMTVNATGNACVVGFYKYLTLIFYAHFSYMKQLERTKDNGQWTFGIIN